MAEPRTGLRSAYGEVIINHKGIDIPTSVGSRAYESLFGGLNSLSTGVVTNGNIPNGYEHRPELIANLFLNSVTGWWVICERNAIFDVFEQLNSGDAIRLPTSL